MVEKTSERIRVFLSNYVQKSRNEFAQLLEQRNQCIAASESIETGIKNCYDNFVFSSSLELDSVKQELEQSENELEQTQAALEDLNHWLEKEKVFSVLLFGFSLF